MLFKKNMTQSAKKNKIYKKNMIKYLKTLIYLEVNIQNQKNTSKVVLSSIKKNLIKINRSLI